MDYIFHAVVIPSSKNANVAAQKNKWKSLFAHAAAPASTFKIQISCGLSGLLRS
jgi:hypothetical protein